MTHHCLELRDLGICLLTLLGWFLLVALGYPVYCWLFDHNRLPRWMR